MRGLDKRMESILRYTHKKKTWQGKFHRAYFWSNFLSWYQIGCGYLYVYVDQVRFKGKNVLYRILTDVWNVKVTKPAAYFVKREAITFMRRQELPSVEIYPPTSNTCVIVPNVNQAEKKSFQFETLSNFVHHTYSLLRERKHFQVQGKITDDVSLNFS